MTAVRHLRALWQRVHEPRAISALTSLAYLILLAVGIYALIDPPRSIEGEIGQAAMYGLAGCLTAGAAIGAPTALAGVWWLERTATSLICLAAGIYLTVTLYLQATSDGNRLLQSGFIAVVLIHQIIRWLRIRQRPYDPARTAHQTAD